MTDIDQIIRYGCSTELADVYAAVRRLCGCHSPSKRYELIADLETAYRACEAAHEGFDDKVEEFYESDGTAAELKHSKGGLP